MGDITRNFSLWEFEASQEATRRGIDNSVPDYELKSIVSLAHWLQSLRDELSEYHGRDVSITISSGYRSPKLNKAIGGSKNSHHMQGLAADIRASGLSPQHLFDFIVDKSDRWFNQCIQEFDSWVHISIPSVNDAVATRQKLKASKVRNMFGRLKTQYEVVA